jgi:hypothetical protein
MCVSKTGKSGAGESESLLSNSREEKRHADVLYKRAESSERSSEREEERSPDPEELECHDS